MRGARVWTWLPVGVALATSSTAAAQSPPAAPEKIAVGDWLLAPSVEMRVRGEYRREPLDTGGLDFFGRRTPVVRDTWAVSERSRLGLGVERGAVRAQLTLQDARPLGTPAPTATLGATPDLGRFEPYEALLEMRSSAARPTYLRLGRQAVVWGEGRLVGNADFSPVGRSLDAMRTHVAVGNFDFEALAAILESPTPLGAPFGQTSFPTSSGVQLYGALARWTLDPLLRVEAYGLERFSRSAGESLDGSRFQAARLSGELTTLALRISGETSTLTYGVEGAYQLGSTSSIAIGGSDIAAWAAAGHVQKTFPELILTPTLRLAGSFASGDDRKGAYKQFDPLLPDPQRFHGQMDLFSWSNAIDAAARVSVVPMTDATVLVEYRHARLAEKKGEWIGSYMNAIGSANVPTSTTTAPTTSDVLGNEIVGFAWRPWLPLELRAGWSGLLIGDGAKDILRAHTRGKTDSVGAIIVPDLAQYAYLQATLTVP